MHILVKQLFLVAMGIFTLCGPAEARSEKETSGKLRIYSRTSHSGAESRTKDTFILWSDSIVEPDEEFDTVVVMWGKVLFNGKAKDLVVLGGEVTLADRSQVEGSLVVLGGKLHKRDGAKVSEQVLFELPSDMPKWIGTLGPVLSFVYSDGAALLYVIVRAVLICLLGALLYLIAPELMREAENMAQANPWQSLSWTILGALIFVPGLFMLIISIVGIMFIPLFVMCYIAIYGFAAFVMAANILGHNLPPKHSVVMPPLRYFYGVFIFVLLSYVPWVGTPLIYLAMSFTAGAMFYTIFHRARNRRKKA